MAELLEEFMTNFAGAKNKSVAASANDFQVDTADYDGTNHQAFRTKLVQLALTEPKAYFRLRSIVLEKVKKEAVQLQYKVYYNLLTQGLDAKGLVIVTDASSTGTGESLKDIMVPCVPAQEANKFALSAAKTIGKICEDAIEMIIPLNYKDIAEERTRKQTEGNLGFN